MPEGIVFVPDISFHKTPTKLFIFSDSICIVSIKSGLCALSSSMLQKSCYKSRTEITNNNVPKFLSLRVSFNMNEKSELMPICHKKKNYVHSNQNEKHRSARTIIINSSRRNNQQDNNWKPQKAITDGIISTDSFWTINNAVVVIFNWI